MIDDSVRHRRAGMRDLRAFGHEVVAMSSYGEARQKAHGESFDAALIDLLMPAEPTTLGIQAVVDHVGRDIGVGFPLIFELALCGISRIAVATDTGHHDHPDSAIVDWFKGRGPLVVNGAKVLIMHAPMRDGAKDWVEILNRLLAI